MKDDGSRVVWKDEVTTKNWIDLMWWDEIEKMKRREDGIKSSSPAFFWPLPRQIIVREDNALRQEPQPSAPATQSRRVAKKNQTFDAGPSSWI